VVSVSPEEGATGVSRDTPLVIRFSETVDAKSLERALWITPGGAAKPKIHVSGEEVTIRTDAGFPESTTVGVLLTTQVRDRRRDTDQNPLRRPLRWVFSTGREIAPGLVRGTLERPPEAAGARPTGAVLVVVVPAAQDSVPELSRVPPIALTEPDSAGAFILAGLPVTGEMIRIVPVYDRDGNRAVSGRGEFVSAASESLVLEAGRPAEVALRLIDPAAPGSLTGTLERAAGDTLGAGVAVFKAGPPDSAAAPVKVGRAGAGGTFTVSGIPPGSYRVTAFCDGNGNGKRDAGEAETDLGSVTVPPGAAFEMGSHALPACPQPVEP
jgi:hypothetical protein